MLYVNQLYYKSFENNIEITLFSKIGYKGRPSTLFFLSKYSCEVGNIKFINSYDELSEYDYLLNKEKNHFMLEDRVNNETILLNNFKEIEDKLYK